MFKRLSSGQYFGELVRAHAKDVAHRVHDLRQPHRSPRGANQVGQRRLGQIEVDRPAQRLARRREAIDGSGELPGIAVELARDKREHLWRNRAALPSGELLVLDTGKKRLQAFDAFNRYRAEWTIPWSVPSRSHTTFKKLPTHPPRQPSQRIANHHIAAVRP